MLRLWGEGTHLGGDAQGAHSGCIHALPVTHAIALASAQAGFLHYQWNPASLSLQARRHRGGAAPNMQAHVRVSALMHALHTRSSQRRMQVWAMEACTRAHRIRLFSQLLRCSKPRTWWMSGPGWYDMPESALLRGSDKTTSPPQQDWVPVKAVCLEWTPPASSAGETLG
jgi:hypothetical protein